MTEVQQEQREQQALDWLSAEFPEWEFEVGQTRTGAREDVSWWVARREGHHPQAALTPGKLYSRLSEYLAREAARRGQRDPESN